MHLRGRRWLRVRRILDALVVFAAAPVLAPICAIAMAAVFAEDRRNPLVRLTRVGRDGSTFRVTKIRSMRVSATSHVAGGAAVTAGVDPRITRVGEKLRSWRLDEIPQVWSVVTGDMALIGPRPEDPRFVDLENEQWQTALAARPAIAGLTQVLAAPWEEANLIGHSAEQTYEEVAVPAKLAIDAWYVENASPRLDWAVITSLADHFLRRSSHTTAHELVEQNVPAAHVFL